MDDTYTPLLEDDYKEDLENPTLFTNSLFIDKRVLINDTFLIQVYNYYFGEGFCCIIVDNLFNLFGLLFLIIFSIIILECIDYEVLFNEHKFENAFKLSGIFHTNWFTVICIIIMCFVFLYKLFRFFNKIKNTFEIKNWYNDNLDIDDFKIKYIKWSKIMKKIIEFFNKQSLETNLTKLDILNRIMRKNNYFIAMIDLDILDFDIYIPFYGNYSFLSKYLEWNLRKCISNYFFDSNSQIKSIFIKSANNLLTQNERIIFTQELQKRFKTMTIINLVCLPFILLFQVTYFFFKYAEEYRRDPNQLGLRQYSHYSRWKLREYNELPHIFNQRLNMSYEDANKYISYFSSKIVEMIKQFVLYIAGSLFIFLTFISILDEEILFNDLIDGRSVLFYIGILGGIVGLCKLIKNNNKIVYKPDILLKRIAIYTHYFPENWKNKEQEYDTYKEFSKYFQVRIYSLLEELFSFVISPYILYYKISKNSDKIVNFFIDYTIYSQNAGHICSFANMSIDSKVLNTKKIKNSKINFNFNYNDDDKNYQKSISKNNLSLIKEDKTCDNSVVSLGLSILDLNDRIDNDNNETINI